MVALARFERLALSGATWIDRQLLAGEPLVARGSCGAEVRNAMERRIDYLAGEGACAAASPARRLFAQSARHLAAPGAGQRGREDQRRQRTAVIQICVSLRKQLTKGAVLGSFRMVHHDESRAPRIENKAAKRSMIA